ncbi:aminotransferase class IV [Aquimarina agarilytica]|uniref:aminotransferase class IV n=1 Tax=Aquimarina agarilytica TaxID=1087449 RepID=UPI00028898E2|nr:aminotransferase class IV [Aquimarina agarilytica]
MINFNGEIVSNTQANLSVFNRGFAYGDAVFETIRVNGNTILFWEDHYFRLMASMRILRMRIPMEFTLEYLEKQILDTVASHGIPKNQSIRVKLSVFRDSDGLYTPQKNSVGFFISIAKISQAFYTLNDIKTTPYEVELYKDHLVANDLLSTLKTNNRILNVLSGIFAKENGFANVLLLNTEKKVIEASNGNIFLIKGNTVKTPPTADGCISGVLKKQLLRILKENKEITLTESSISAFELQKADELFVTNVISGITSISKYRKKYFSTDVTKKILNLLNTDIRLKK